LPKHKNNKASSLTNLFRNQGGSFGIAFVTTVLARRTQYHQTVLVAHSTPFDAGYQRLLGNLTGYFTTHGFAHADAIVHAQAQAFQLLERQAAYLAFLDCFTALGWFVLLGVPLVFLIRRFTGQASSGGH
jgi:DHA2 family multidrug resistance protein